MNDYLSIYYYLRSNQNNLMRPKINDTSLNSMGPYEPLTMCYGEHSNLTIKSKCGSFFNIQH